MAGARTRYVVSGRDAAMQVFRDEGCSAPRPWGNGPGDKYAPHTHPYHKVLFCLDGSITFHLAEGDVRLEAGDRLYLEPGTEHSAIVGAEGCSCLEASR